MCNPISKAIDELRLTGMFDSKLILSIWGPQIRDSLLEKFESDKVSY